MANVVERFLRYVQFDTQSDEYSESVPSTPGQMKFAKYLAQELAELGLEEINLDDRGYLFATLPAKGSGEVPTIGLIAHLDTSPDMPGANVKPRVVENYAGGDIVLNEAKGIVLSCKDFPELADYQGKDLITTDGTTLLGADDKAGVAEIISAVEYLIAHPDIPHGKIRLAFTPDEEVGRGADHFDVAKFGADLAYTVDGGPLGELEYENFNAAKATVTIQGRNVHPGTAKDKMINSLLLAAELITMLPAAETPAHTAGYEGFYHLTDAKGEVEQTVLHYIIRDFDRDNFARRKENLLACAAALNTKYGQGICRVELKDQYFNMKEKIEPVKYIVDTAFKAMQEVGVTPQVQPIRGGTDGARLSFMGLPTPNLFTGGHNFHGKYEFIPTFAMEKAVEVILKIIQLHAQVSR